MIFGYTPTTTTRDVYGDWFVGEDRDIVARELFRRNPKAHTVTTCDAYALNEPGRSPGKHQHVYTTPDGVTWANRSTDIRWVNRRDMK